jgi:hypothetical protein
MMAASWTNSVAAYTWVDSMPSSTSESLAFTSASDMNLVMTGIIVTVTSDGKWRVSC